MMISEYINISELYSLKDAWNTPIQEAMITSINDIYCGEKYAYVLDEEIRIFEAKYLYRDRDDFAIIGLEDGKTFKYYLKRGSIYDKINNNKKRR